MTGPQEKLLLAAKIAALTLVLVVLQAIGSQLLPAMPGGDEATGAADISQPTPQPSAGFLALVLSVALLQTVALAYPVLRSRWHGGLLIFTVFALFFGTVTFLSQIESLVYLGGRMPEGMQAGLFLMGLFTATVFSPILVITLGKWKPVAERSDEPRRPRVRPATWVGRLALGAAVFLAFYYLFGYFVAWKDSAVREYYGGTDPGTFIAQMRSIVRDTPWMVPLQYVRGLLWVLLAQPVIRMMRGPWWEAGLAVSLLFTLPAVYLLFPNPLMPEAVRMAHLVETAPYQFLFGWFVVWLFTRRPGRATLSTA